MFTVVMVLSIGLIITGVLTVAVAFRTLNKDRSPISVEQNRIRSLQGLLSAGFSAGALLFLFTGYGTPLEVLLALALCLGGNYLAIRLLRGSQLFGGEESGMTIMARDAVSGEEVGFILGSVRANGSDITSYKIRTKQGVLVERPADSILIDVR